MTTGNRLPELGRSVRRAPLTIVGAAWLLAMLGSTVAHAFPGPLNLTTTPPDILVSDLAINFNDPPPGPAGSLTAVNTGSSTFSFTPDGVQNIAVNGAIYNLDIELDGPNNDNFLGGTITIIGGVAALGIPNGSTLLAGDITDFGAVGGGQVGVFEFQYDVTASDPNLGFGSQGGTIITSTNLAPGYSMTADFSGTGNSNNFVVATTVPEPGSIALLALGGVGMLGMRRRRAVRRAKTGPADGTR